MRPIQIWDLENFFKSLEGHSLPAYLASNSYSFALPELDTPRGAPRAPS